MRPMPPNGSVSTGASFALFPGLPEEIRLLIWETAIPGPRLVYIRQHKLKQKEVGNGHQGRRDGIRERRQDEARGSPSPDKEATDYLWGYKSELQPPAILFVCRESHSVASRFYTKTFSGTNLAHEVLAIPETYFDYQRDILYLSQKDTFSGQIRDGRELTFLDMLYANTSNPQIEEAWKVKNLAICLDFSDYDMDSFVEWFKYVLSIFSSVRALVFVLEEDTYPPYEQTLTDAEMAWLPPPEVQDIRRAYEIYKMLGIENLNSDRSDPPYMLSLDSSIIDAYWVSANHEGLGASESPESDFMVELNDLLEERIEALKGDLPTLFSTSR